MFLQNIIDFLVHNVDIMSRNKLDIGRHKILTRPFIGSR
jgi:hypothetical protein